MEEEVFKFKNFDVRHGKGSMKVGVDAVLLGSWAGMNPKSILDVGTGSGVISLILAQRFPEAEITGIDIDIPSIEEASLNFKESPWPERLRAELSSFPEDLLINNKKYDLIVSNPPFFKSGIKNPSTQREKARHQATLSIYSLIENSKVLLTEKGRLSMIFPLEYEENIKEQEKKSGLNLNRLCRIRDREGKKGKRVMMEFSREKIADCRVEELILFEGGIPTDDYKRLCRPFYLKW